MISGLAVQCKRQSEHGLTVLIYPDGRNTVSNLENIGWA